MPSLPELEVYKHTFGPRLAGRKITRLEPLDWRVVRADLKLLESLLVGHDIARIDRYGKWLILNTSAPGQVILHLGLTGKLKLLEPGEKNPRFSCFAFEFEDSGRLMLTDQRKLGRIYVRDFADLKAEKALGPDLLDVSEDYFTTTLGRKRRGARDVLMDQKIVAGIGGKYADEILWQARLHPNIKLDSLEPAKLAELYRITMDVTRRAIELDAAVERFPEDWLIPHRHGDKLCPHCGAPLTERRFGGSEAYYCPNDQPPPNPSRSG
jgi:formamidopyrimidine-DNA glycosylase